MKIFIKIIGTLILTALFVGILLTSSCFVIKSDLTLRYFGFCANAPEPVAIAISLVSFILGYFVLRKLIDYLGL